MTAGIQAQFLNTGCMQFSVGWVFDTFTALVIQPRADL